MWCTSSERSLAARPVPDACHRLNRAGSDKRELRLSGAAAAVASQVRLEAVCALSKNGRDPKFSKYLDNEFQKIQVEFAKLNVMMDTHSSSKKLKHGTSDPTGESARIYMKVCTEASQATNESQKIKIEESQAEESQKIEESQAIDEIEESQASEESQAIEEAIEENLDGSEDSEATLQWGRPPPRRLRRGHS